MPIPEAADGDAKHEDTDSPAPDRPVAPSLLPTGPAAPGSGRRPAVASAVTAAPYDEVDPDLDGWDDPEDEGAAHDEEPNDGADQAAVPGHFVMDRAAIQAALDASGCSDTRYDHLSSGEEQRVRTLVQYRRSSLFRPHLIGTPARLARLDELDRAAPNFEAVTRLVRRAAALSQVAGMPLRVPPLVLLGSPGIGKSRYAKALASALGTSCHTVSGSTLPDVGSLTGYPPVWRGAGPGRLAKFLISATTSSPLIFTDEAEKIVDYEAMAHPLDRLLPILEYGTA